MNSILFFNIIFLRYQDQTFYKSILFNNIFVFYSIYCILFFLINKIILLESEHHKNLIYLKKKSQEHELRIPFKKWLWKTYFSAFRFLWHSLFNITRLANTTKVIMFRTKKKETKIKLTQKPWMLVISNNKSKDEEDK